MLLCRLLLLGEIGWTITVGANREEVVLVWRTSSPTWMRETAPRKRESIGTGGRRGIRTGRGRTLAGARAATVIVVVRCAPMTVNGTIVVGVVASPRPRRARVGVLRRIAFGGTRSPVNKTGNGVICLLPL